MQEKSSNQYRAYRPREVMFITIRTLGAARVARYPAFAAGHAASSVRSAATKASGWSIIT
jgi:hypothetical protein